MRFGTEIRQVCGTAEEASNLAGVLGTLAGCIRTGIKSEDWRAGTFAGYGVFASDCGPGTQPASVMRVCLIGSDERRANEMESVQA